MADRSAPHPFICTASFGIVALPVAGIGLIILPPLLWVEAVLAIIAGLLFMGAAWLYYATINEDDISRLAPMMRLTSLQTLLLSVIFLGESLSSHQQAAFVVMLISGLLLSLKLSHNNLTLSRAALRMIPVTTLLAVDSVLMAHVYRSASVWQGEVWYSLGIIMGLILTGGIAWWRRWPIWIKTDRRTWSVLILEQVTRQITNLAPAWAIASGMPVALLSALGGVNLVWVWLLAILVLREPVVHKELIFKGGGILGMALGVYWLM
jgi:uncharacterized membrane protein